LARQARDAAGRLQDRLERQAAQHRIATDRMDITGACWGLQGAEAVLTVRVQKANGDFEDYCSFHLKQEYQRVHRDRYQEGFTLAA
jgi:hypothetical protein